MVCRAECASSSMSSGSPPLIMQQEFIAATELQQKLERAGQVFQPGRLELDLGQDIEPQWPVPCLQIEGISDVQAQQEATQQAETVMQSASAALASWSQLRSLQIRKSTRNVSISPLLGAASQIRTLDLSACKLRSAEVPQLSASLPYLHTLKLGLPLPEPEHLASLSGLQSLRVLDCNLHVGWLEEHKGLLEPDHLQALKDMTQLTSLQLGGGSESKVAVSQLSPLSQLTALRSLALPLQVATGFWNDPAAPAAIAASTGQLQPVLGSLTGLTSLRLFMHMPRPELLFPIRSCTSLQRLEVHCHHECIGYSHDPDLQAKGQEVISALSHASTIITVYDKLCDGGRWISWLWQPNVKWVCNNWKYDPWCRRLTPQ